MWSNSSKRRRQQQQQQQQHNRRIRARSLGFVDPRTEYAPEVEQFFAEMERNMEQTFENSSASAALLAVGEPEDSSPGKNAAMAAAVADFDNGNLENYMSKQRAAARMRAHEGAGSRSARGEAALAAAAAAAAAAPPTTRPQPPHQPPPPPKAWMRRRVSGSSVLAAALS